MEIVYRLKDEHLDLLRAEHGVVVKEKLPPLKEPIFVVGDFSSAFMLERGFLPQIVIYDFKIEREEISPEIRSEIENYSVKKIKVKNPKSRLTRKLIDAVKRGLEERVKIEVDGEDDLAALAIVGLAEKGTLLYGLPGAGMVVGDIGELKRSMAPILEEIDFK